MNSLEEAFVNIGSELNDENRSLNDAGINI